MRYVDRPETGMVKAQKSLDKTGRYNSDAVKSYLSKTYKGICAYCEAEVEVTNYLEVEHFHPKSHYPLLKLDIHNLHLACKRCNNPKGAITTPILSPNFYLKDPTDPSYDWKTYLESELKSRIWYHGHLLFTKDDDEVAKNTIKTLRLNNKEKTGKRVRLIESRLRVYSTALNSIKIIIESIRHLADILGSTPYDIYDKQYKFIILSSVCLSKDTLLSMMNHGAPYSQMIIDNFSDPLLNCLKIIDTLAPKDVYKLSNEKIDEIIKSVERMKSHLDNC